MTFPIDPQTLAAFMLACLAIVVSPGPDTMLILRHSLASGHRVGLAAVAGVQVGLVGHTVLALLGISLLIASSPVLFRLVALTGAVYLGWLGLQGLRATGSLVLGAHASIRATAWRAARQAVLTNLLNPKVILLYLALFPQFLQPARGDVPVQLIALAGVLIVINVAWQVPLVLGAAAARRWLDRPAVQRGIARATGAIFLAFAALMLWEHLIR